MLAKELDEAIEGEGVMDVHSFAYGLLMYAGGTVKSAALIGSCYGAAACLNSVQQKAVECLLRGR